MTAPSKILYDRESAAEQLSTTPRQIDELRRSRKLVGVQMGRQWKYTHTELVRYAESLVTSVEMAS